MSLLAVSVPLAVEPKTNAAMIFLAKGRSASVNGKATPNVLSAIPRSSGNTEASGFAWYQTWFPRFFRMRSAAAVSFASSA